MDDVQRTLGRIEAKLDAVLETQQKHEQRLDVLDAIKNKGYGIITAVTIGAGAIGAWLNKAMGALFHSGQP